MATILGIDPGVATVGFGVIKSSGSKQQLVRYGIISTPAGQRLSERLQQIYHDMLELIDIFQPDAISVEELFFNNNITTGISVAHGRGVVLLAGQEKGIPMFEYTPLQVKKAITGYGRANKKQMMEMVRRLLNMSEVAKPDDAADALALAICHSRFSISLLNIDGGNNICSTI